MDLHSRRKSSVASQGIESSPISRLGRRSSIVILRTELNPASRPARRPSVASQGIESSPISRLGRRSSIATQRTEPNPASQPARRPSVASRGTEPSPVYRPERRLSIASHRTELSPDSRLGRRSSIASGRTEPNLASQSRRRSNLVSPQREKAYTVPQQWEESSFVHRSRRRLSPVPQKEPSLMSRTDPPAVSQFDWEIDREDPSVRARVRTEPPSSPLRENMTLSRRNRASRHSMETP